MCCFSSVPLARRRGSFVSRGKVASVWFSQMSTHFRWGCARMMTMRHLQRKKVSSNTQEITTVLHGVQAPACTSAALPLGHEGSIGVKRIPERPLAQVVIARRVCQTKRTSCAAFRQCTCHGEGNSFVGSCPAGESQLSPHVSPIFVATQIQVSVPRSLPSQRIRTETLPARIRSATVVR